MTKLEWIGFDACLMSSLEVASVLAPYADYMIASQETEPGWGWNYAFLSVLSDRAIPGDEMGEYIVDSYMDYGEYVFDYYPNLYSDLTLSCIDLNAYAEAEDALNTYFAELDTSLDVQNYPKLVRNRAKVRDFGSYSSDMNYGMVDVLHMLELLGDNSDTAKVATRAVESCIAYSDTNMENAGGISICYPYQTDEDYRDACIEMQEYLGFAPNYTRFLQDFYAIQNGDTLLADREISNAHTTVTTENDGTYDESDITLQLTPEQQANFASGGYYILCKAKEEGYITSEEDPRADEMYLFIQGSKRVTLDENGVLHAAYKNNALYMEDDDGVSDIPMILTESDISDVENRYLSFVVLMNFDNWESQAAKLQIAVNEDYPDGIIRNAIPLSDDDDDVQSASKQLIRLDDYANMSVAARCSYVTRDENGDLLDFFDWETSKWMMGFEVDLTSDYRTVVQPLDHPENYVCIFFMKDSQGNVSYSDMIPLKEVFCFRSRDLRKYFMDSLIKILPGFLKPFSRQYYIAFFRHLFSKQRAQNTSLDDLGTGVDELTLDLGLSAFRCFFLLFLSGFPFLLFLLHSRFLKLCLLLRQSFFVLLQLGALCGKLLCFCFVFYSVCQHFVGRNIVHCFIVASHAVPRHQVPALRLVHRSHKTLRADDGGTLGNAGHAVLVQEGCQCFSHT